MFQIKVIEKTKPILCPITFSENRAVYEIMSKDMVEPEMPRMTSQYGASRCMLYKQRYMRASARASARMRARTHTHTQNCAILTALPRQQ